MKESFREKGRVVREQVLDSWRKRWAPAVQPVEGIVAYCKFFMCYQDKQMARDRVFSLCVVYLFKSSNGLYKSFQTFHSVEFNTANICLSSTSCCQNWLLGIDNSFTYFGKDGNIRGNTVCTLFQSANSDHAGWSCCLTQHEPLVFFKKLLCLPEPL